MSSSQGRGRPSKYDPRLHVALARWMARCGLTDAEIGRQLGVAASTFRLWKKRYTELSAA